MNKLHAGILAAYLIIAAIIGAIYGSQSWLAAVGLLLGLGATWFAGEMLTPRLATAIDNLFADTPFADRRIGARQGRHFRP